MGDRDLEELLRKLQAGEPPQDTSKLGECLRSMGLDGSNPEAAGELLEKLGMNPQAPPEKEEIISQINELTGGFSQEKRQQLGGLFQELTHQMGYEELPPDFTRFFEDWEKGK